MSVRIRSQHYKSELPGKSSAIVLAAAYGRRVGARNQLLSDARFATEDGERSRIIGNAKNWHRMAMKSLRELRAAVES